MKGAFVVQIRPRTEAALSDLSGSVEEVDTGKGTRFQTAEELLRFLRNRSEEFLCRYPLAESPTEAHK